MRLFKLLSPLLAAIIESGGAHGADVTEGSCGLDGASCAASSDDSSASDTSAARSSSWELPRNSSIIDFLNPKILDPEVMAEIQTNMLSGNLVVIRDAFLPEFAEYVWEHLNREEFPDRGTFVNPTKHGKFFNRTKEFDDEKLNLRYLRNEIKKVISKARKKAHTETVFDAGSQGHVTNKKEFRKVPNRMRRFISMLKNEASKEFLSKLSGRSCMGKCSLIPTHYDYGDYSGPHADIRNVRAVDFVWNLSKDWDPNWGGSFYWGNAKTLKEGYFHPTFNSLIIFLPGMETVHWVTPVNHGAESKRFTISGKFESLYGDALNITEPIEEVYGNKLDHGRLTLDEAVWIVDEMVPENYTEDVQRHHGLRDLQQSIKKNYLYPENNQTFVVSWDDDGEDDKTEEEAKIETEDISITAESSILDFLDPDIAKDTELLTEIGSNLRQGKLVVIRDAFRADFAEYAWKELNGKDIEWAQRNNTRNKHAIDSPHVSKPSSHSKELSNVLSIFTHKKTAEFLESIAGRSCGGNELNKNRAQPYWYKKGAFSQTTNGFHGSNTVQLRWDLTKSWDPTWGGAFFYFPARTLKRGYFHRTFNTLIMHLPTPSSTYAIPPVAWWAEGKLYEITASYHSTNEDFASVVMEDRLGEVYAKDEDLIGLTHEQADYIVHQASTKDPLKVKKLKELKERVSDKYLKPSSGTTLVIE